MGPRNRHGGISVGASVRGRWASLRGGAGLTLAVVICSAGSAAAPSAEALSPAIVARLQPKLAYRLDTPHGLAGAPLVNGSTLLAYTGFPHTLLAFDLARPGFPLKWQFRPVTDGRAEGLACCDTVNSGPTSNDGQVLVTTLDGHVVALGAGTGDVAWNSRAADMARGETLTGAPLVVGDVVLVGNSGDDDGARGWVAALDASTGRELWRRFSTGPDADVGIDAQTRPHAAGSDAGVHEWSNAGWQHGGGEVSGQLAADPDGTTVYHGTGHAAPWDPDQRLGRNNWTSSLVARDVKTGAVRWIDQLAAHDDFGLGSTGAMLLADRDWHGTPRKLLIHPARNGYLYVLDRTTGEILSAKPFTSVNETNGVDPVSGATLVADERKARFATMTRDICPGWPGATDGGATLSPDATIVFIPVSRLCMDLEARNVSFIPGTAFIGANVREKRPRDGDGGALVAWDVAAERPAWSTTEHDPLAGGVLAVDDLVFFGTLDGLFKALDARTGRELWRFQCTSGIIGRPIAFHGPDGRVYVAVMAGLGGPFGVVARHGIDKRDATAAHGMANALADLAAPTDPSGTLYVFGLP